MINVELMVFRALRWASRSFGEVEGCGVEGKETQIETYDGVIMWKINIYLK